MLTGNLVLIAIIIQTLAISAGIAYYIFKNKKPKEAPPVVVIENLPEGISEGFGYVKGKSVILNEYGIPYLYKTFREAQNNMRKVKGVDKIIHQKWELATQTLVVRDIINGTNKR